MCEHDNERERQREKERERERERESNRRRKKQFRVFLLRGLNLHKCEKSNTSPYLCTLQLSGMINEINQGLDF